MTIYELLRLAQQHSRKIASVAVACALVCFVGSAAFSLVKSSYQATSTLVSIGGSFASVSGIGSSMASQESHDGVSVTASATSSNNTIVFKATGSSSEAVRNAVNTVANETGERAKSSNVANSCVVTEANEAVSTGKNPFFYAVFGLAGGAILMTAYIALRTSMRGVVLSPSRVEECGLFYLGAADGKKSSERTIVANFLFRGGQPADHCRVLLHPTSKSVRVNEVGSMISAEARKVDVVLRKAPPLEESAYTICRGYEADAIVVVVEEGVSTVPEIEEIKREFEIAELNIAGFVYMPHK